MTNQAHEILIIDGFKTSMKTCPPVPENDPRITEHPKTRFSTACWRGYIGTWEIRDNQFFLVNLTGKYELREDFSILADWFSGELMVPQGNILKYIHNITPLYESEKHITVKHGVVKTIVVKDNRPSSPEANAKNSSKDNAEVTQSEAAEIHHFVKNRGIQSLIHFTNVSNVPGILTHGILGREALQNRGLSSSYNDQYRYDGVPNAVCASISFPNYKMFYSLQQGHPEVDWAVIKISSNVLWEVPCAYCNSNAASNAVTKVPIKDRMGLTALKSMFGDFSPEIKRESLRIPDAYTTNPQAEILILGEVSPSYIIDVNVNSKERIRDISSMIKLFKPFADRFKFVHNETLFSPRQDYEHWASAQTSSGDMGIDVSKLFDI